jgi:outer membrane protease
LLVSAAASPGIDTEYLHFRHPAYRSTTFPWGVGKGPHDPSWSGFPDLPPDPSLASCDVCLAETTPPDIRLLRVDVGVRTWLSYAQAKESRSIGVVDVLSELKWRNMVSEVFEANITARWFERFIMRLDIGIGDVSGGRFRDQDFAISGRQGLFSDTLHPAFDDDLLFANVEVGWRLIELPLISLDGLVGYQRWREKYISQGGVDVFSTALVFPPDVLLFPPGTVITQEFSWDGFRVGLEGAWYATPKWTFNSRIMLMPLPHLELVDIHHLRDDLRKDPSFVSRSDGGIGVMTDMLATYELWDGMLLEIGYRLWHVNSSDGDVLVRHANSSESRILFNGAEMTRHGLVLGLSLHF